MAAEVGQHARDCFHALNSTMLSVARLSFVIHLEIERPDGPGAPQVFVELGNLIAVE